MTLCSGIVILSARKVFPGPVYHLHLHDVITVIIRHDWNTGGGGGGGALH